MEKNRQSQWSLRSVKWAILLVGLAGSEGLVAQQSLETFYRTTGNAVTDIFEPQRAVIQKCSAIIYNGRNEIAYGIVVSPDGHILTKASEIEGIDPITVRVDREAFDEVKVISVDPRWDVALIKVEAKDLSPAEYAPDSKLAQGHLVVVNGATSRTKRRILAGIISASAREIPAAGGAALGVTLADAKDKLEVKEVTEGGGAAIAGVLAGDVIVELDGKKVVKIENLGEIMKEKKVGDEVKIKVKRGGKDVDLTVKLTAKAELFLQPDRNDQMSGDFSKRRSGFSRVIQHDILANKSTMGGPVLDMKGRVIGMNIARANRCETFAIPVEELRELAKQMMEKAVD
jgi:serine protease Do